MASISSNGTGGGGWSTGGTWAGGIAPADGDKVTIVAGDTVTVDGTITAGDDTTGSTISTAAINVSGTLKASRSVNNSLTVHGLLLCDVNTQALDYGTDASPIPLAVTAQLILNKATSAAVRKGLDSIATGGASNSIKWTFVGDDTRVRGVTLQSDAVSGATSLTLSSSSHGWQNGDTLFLFNTTNTASVDECEEVTISTTSGATINLTGSLSHKHIAGSPVVNETCNVIVSSFNQVSGQTGWANLQATTSGTAPTNGATFEFKNTQFLNLAAGTGGINNAGVQISTGLGTNLNSTFHKCVFKQNLNTAGLISQSFDRDITIDNCVCLSNTGGFMNLAASFATVSSSYIGVGGALVSAGGTVPITFNNTWITNRDFTGNFVSENFATFTNCTLSGFGGQVLSANSLAMTFNNCDLGSTYGWNSSGTSKVYNLGSADFAIGQSTFNNCLLNSIFNTPETAANLKNQSSQFAVQYINKNQSTTTQEAYYAAGTATRNNSTFHRSTSSFDYTFNNTGQTVTRTISFPAAANEAITIVGYCQFDTTFNNSGTFDSPTAVMTNQSGVTQGTPYTATSAANGAWEKFTITATNTGAAGTWSLALNADGKATTGGNVYFDGVPDSQFITKCRHYGYTFDEGNVKRTTNPSVSASESAASGLTGITVSGGTSNSPVTVTASTTFQNMYDYTQYWSVTNLADAVPMSAVGVAGNITISALANITVTTGTVLNGAGALAMGTFTLQTEFSGGGTYTYTGGTWSQLTTEPTFNGGTLDMPAEGTYNFVASAPIIEFNPSASGVTYIFSGGVFSGTLDLRNLNSHPLTLDLPTGATFVTTSNTGGVFTVVLPQIFQSVSISGYTLTSRIQLYDNTANNVSAVTVGNPTDLTVTGHNIANSNSVYINGLGGADAGLLNNTYQTATVIDANTISVPVNTTGKTITAGSGTVNEQLSNSVPTGSTFTWTDPNPALNSRSVRLRVAYATSSTANIFLEQVIGTTGTTSGNAAISFNVNPVTDTVYVANLIDGTAITDCSITGNNLHVDINTGSTTWQHIYAFMTYWLSTVVGIEDQFLEMTATDQTHYVFSAAHGGYFKVKNVTTGPTVPLLITGGNANPSDGSAATNILDTTGGSIFAIEGEVVPFTTSSQGVNLATVQAGIDSRFNTSVAGRPDVNIAYVNATKVNGVGSSGNPWGP